MELRNVTCKCCTAPLDPSGAEGNVLRCTFCGTAFMLAKSSEPKVQNFLDQGEHDLDTCKFDDAYAAYQKAAELDKEEPEAYFGMALSAFKVQYLKDETCDPPRMQPICHEISAKSFCADKNYRRALQFATDEQRQEYERRAAEIDAIKREFYDLQRKGLDYDCFLCVKVTEEDGRTRTADYDRANDIYYYLKDEGYKPFFSEREMKGREGANYEALILYALYTSECMLIVCSDESYLQTKWVKNEYTRFASMIANEEKERDAVSFAFHGTPIERLPGRSGKIQGVDLAKPDAYTRIHSFVAGHLSAAAEGEGRRVPEPPHKAEQRRVPQPPQQPAESRPEAAINVAPTAASLCARGYEKLAARDFTPARDLFERALELEPGNAASHWGVFLCDFRAVNEQEIACTAETLTKIRQNADYAAALHGATGEMRARVERFCSAMAEQAEVGIGKGEAGLRDLRAKAEQTAQKSATAKAVLQKAQDGVKNFNLARKEWAGVNAKYGVIFCLCAVAAAAVFEVVFNLYAPLPMAWQVVVAIFGGVACAILGGLALNFLLFLIFSSAITASEKRKKKKLSEKYSIPLEELTDAALKGDKKGTGKGLSAAEKRLRQAQEIVDALNGELKTLHADFLKAAEEDAVYHQAASLLVCGKVCGGAEAAGLLPRDLKETYLALLAESGGKTGEN